MTNTEQEYTEALTTVENYTNEQYAIKFNNKVISNPISFSAYQKAKSLIDTYLKQKNQIKNQNQRKLHF